MRSYLKRIRRRPEPTPVLTADQREDLKRQLSAIPDGASEAHPAFLALLEYWFGIPSDCRPVTVPAYCLRDGSWLTAGVPPVINAVQRAIEAD